MSNIRITPDRMRECSGMVRGERDVFEGVISKMHNILDELETDWAGEASRSFRSQFEALQPSFQSMRQLLDDMSMQLDGTANAYEDLDVTLASKYGV